MFFGLRPLSGVLVASILVVFAATPTGAFRQDLRLQPSREPPCGPIREARPRTISPRVSLSRTVSFNMVWLVLTGILVIFMQVGFAMVETGLCRAKNAADTISMNLMVFALACLAFWGYGFAFGWGNWANGCDRRQALIQLSAREHRYSIAARGSFAWRIRSPASRPADSSMVSSVLRVSS